MPIQFDNETKQFHLYNDTFSYIIKIFENGYIGQVYFGARISPARAHPLLGLIPFNGFSNNDRSPVRFEYPGYGNGDFRLPAFSLAHHDGSGVTDPCFETYRIYTGKLPIPGLPSTYTEQDDEAETLEITLGDALSGLKIQLYYSIYSSCNALVRHTSFINTGSRRITLKNAMSLSLDMPDAAWNMLTFTGAWAREFQVTESPLRPGYQGVQSARGISGHQANPSLLFRRFRTSETAGEAFGVGLIYSGNFSAGVEVDYWDIARIRVGINPDTFSWALEPGAVFDTPEAIVTWSDQGLNGVSQSLHTLYRTRLARGLWRDKERPVLINNWEGTYFNFTQEKILAMAQTAKDMGIELFVLDDGWFGSRDDDHTSLGDWFPDTKKLPEGITGLAQKVCALGLAFGLWIEPEMISEKSLLFQAHPDWAVGVPDRVRTEARNQYVLDMGRPEIVDYLFDTLGKILSTAPISYIKWDMNRCLTEPYSLKLPPERQGEFFHRYVLGVYNLYKRLTEAFPQVLFESCASGGARFDAGILAFAPQGWLSDDTDGVERLTIQRGASYSYPLSSIGAHVSAVPNHQTGRITPLSFRAMTAFFGVLGFELDPTKLSEEEIGLTRECIAFYKQYRKLFQTGLFSRLEIFGSPHIQAWMVASPDKSQAIVGVYKIHSRPNQKPVRLYLTHLCQEALYEVSLWEAGGFDEIDKALNCGIRGGDELLSAGLLLCCGSPWSLKYGDFFSQLFLLEKTQQTAK